MLKTLHHIPTHLVLGFLGSGKTTAILHLLAQKPRHESWAVLVNEFGQVGVDGEIYQAAGITVKEVAGGCLCCAVGLPFQVSVNQLLRQARPDRLLIEPSGLGHPAQILKQLLNDIAPNVLDVRATLCLLDPRHLQDKRYSRNESFIDQLALADVLIANKTDLADCATMTEFYQWAESYRPKKALIVETQFGRLSPEWLNLSRNPERQAAFPTAHQDGGMIAPNWQTLGWVYDANACFAYDKVMAVLQSLNAVRVKGVIKTEKGCFICNGADQALTITACGTRSESRIELITDRPMVGVKAELEACLME